MTDTTDNGDYTNTCECGWEVTGPLDDVVDETIEHGWRVHNMHSTRDQVLSVLLGIDPPEPKPWADT